MCKIQHLILLAILIIFSSCQQNLQKSVYSEVILEGQQLIDSIQQNEKIPGIDVAVSINGELVWSQGFGLADIEHHTPVIAGETRFRIGSVSKPLTAVALGKLMDAGKMDIQSSLQTYVPYFPEKKYEFTIKQLGGHLAGIRHYRNLEFLMADHFNSVKDGLEIFSNDTLLFQPGSKFSYSSYGYNLLSAAIEGASGEAFLPFIKQEVFSPLGMTSTCPDKNDSIIIDRTSFYQIDSLENIINAPYVDNSYKWAGGGFISTTNDLIKFGEAMMKPGFVSEETYRELTTPQTLNDGSSTGYGIGWRSWENNDLKIIGHGGGSVGGITDFRIYPEQHMVIVLLSNSSDTRYGDVADRIAEKFLEAKNE